MLLIFVTEFYLEVSSGCVLPAIMPFFYYVYFNFFMIYKNVSLDAQKS